MVNANVGALSRTEYSHKILLRPKFSKKFLQFLTRSVKESLKHFSSYVEKLQLDAFQLVTVFARVCYNLKTRSPDPDGYEDLFKPHEFFIVELLIDGYGHRCPLHRDDVMPPLTLMSIFQQTMEPTISMNRKNICFKCAKLLIFSTWGLDRKKLTPNQKGKKIQ